MYDDQLAAGSTGCSESDDQADTGGPGQCGMEVDVVDAAGGLAWQPRRVEVVDVAVLRVEEIEHVEREPRAVTEACSPLRRFTRLVALERTDRPRRAAAARSTATARFRRCCAAVDGRAAGHDSRHGARNEVARGIVVVKSRARDRDVGVERQPGPRRVVVRPLDAVPVARTTGLGRSGVADEDQLRIEAQRPEARLVCRRGIRTLRMPTSAPSRAPAASPVRPARRSTDRRVIVAPRASLL